MDTLAFKQRRESLRQLQLRYRNLCTQCLQPQFSCYCEHIQKFDPEIKFVILIHPIEMKRRIATGRMSHLCLENSELIVGHEYSENKRVNELLLDPTNQCSVLYPGVQATNLSKLADEERSSLFDPSKKPVLFVIDGTWATARKTMHLSHNLRLLPKLCFTPERQSQFRVRKQPGVNCFSTIEAVHQVIELLGDRGDFKISQGKHENLIYVFNKMVERQIEFVNKALSDPSSTSYRRPLKLKAL
jgi:DTW domain-containing protein YfiP